MSYSRDRQELAQQMVADGVTAGTISEACGGCPASYNMSVAAMLATKGPDIEGVSNIAESYLARIAGCTGEVCLGHGFSERDGQAQAQPPVAPPHLRVIE